MDALIVYPENKEQLEALKSVIQSMKIAFEEKLEIYPSKVVDGIKESLAEAKDQQLSPYSGIDTMLSERRS